MPILGFLPLPMSAFNQNVRTILSPSWERIKTWSDLRFWIETVQLRDWEDKQLGCLAQSYSQRARRRIEGCSPQDAQAILDPLFHPRFVEPHSAPRAMCTFLAYFGPDWSDIAHHGVISPATVEKYYNTYPRLKYFLIWLGKRPLTSFKSSGMITLPWTMIIS